MSDASRRRRVAAGGLAAGAALAGLAGCASLPDMAAAPQIKPPAAYATTQSFAAPTADWPASDWWRAYGDDQLTGLIGEALNGSPTLAAAQARVDKANAQLGQARSSLFPTLNGNGSVSEYKQSYNAGFPVQFVPKGYNDIGQLTLNFNYELDFWGKNRKAVAAATSDASAAQADAAEARLMLSTQIAQAYADLSRLYAERDVAQESVASRQDTLKLVGDRVTNGLDTRGELSEAQAGVPTAKAQLAAIDEDIALTRNQLAALLGEGPDRGLSIDRPKPGAIRAFGLPQTLAADLIGRRPDVVAARWRAEAAAKRIGVAKAQFYPDINLVAYVGLSSLHLDKLFASGSDIGQVGPAVSLPIFEGGRLRANLRGARADYDEAVASYNGALVQALQQVADAAASTRALQDRLSQSRAALAADEDAYRIAKLRYEGGLANYQSVLLAEDHVLASRQAVADLDARAFMLDVQLVKALGGGFDQTAASKDHING